MSEKEFGPYRIRLTQDPAGYAVSKQGGDLFTVDSVEYKDSVVKRLRIDLPGRGAPVPLTYSPGRKKLSVKLAKTLGVAAMYALAKFVARENARKGYVPHSTIRIGTESPGSAASTAKTTAIFAAGGAALASGKDIASFINRPQEGYYDGQGQLVVRGELGRPDLLPRGGALDL
ncbi:hypothetical protein [Micromonospora endolithica]|uniref:Uncharacterized protein n=1 Tax=Micromonospora endolithica TaxID=230091 RepID=A0A3A9ZID6_9ACTN|nr:hypothetical protein [Micromonospora endolithica]RKN48202.1 hypothetical protein D7223_09175 [Micromonospora endolithica]TWJ24762.1 hypothetical protein JD76_04918 [Micromonospora endolithica]